MYIDAIKLLRQLGYSFSLDYDDTVLIESPLELNKFECDRFIETHRADIERSLKFRAEDQRRRCHGGPLNGQEHGWCTHKNFFTYREAPQKWVVYRLMDDGRAFFAGYATSKAKAKIIASEKVSPK